MLVGTRSVAQIMSQSSAVLPKISQRDPWEYLHLQTGFSSWTEH